MFYRQLPVFADVVFSAALCKAKRQYLRTLQLNRYCLLALQSSAVLPCVKNYKNKFISVCMGGSKQCQYHWSFVRESPVKTKKMYNICTISTQRLRRWFNIVQMLYKCVVFTMFTGRVSQSAANLWYLSSLLPNTLPAGLESSDPSLIAKFRIRIYHIIHSRVHVMCKVCLLNWRNM